MASILTEELQTRHFECYGDFSTTMHIVTRCERAFPLFWITASTGLVPAVVFDVKGICCAVKTKRHERTGKTGLFRCVEGTDLVIECVSLTERVRIELDQFDTGIKKRDAGVVRNCMPLPIRSASRITKQMRTAICGGLDLVVGANRKARP